MKHFFLIALITFPISMLHAQASIDYFGFNTSAPQSSYSGWGGGTNILSAPTSLNAKDAIFPLKVQLGGGFYIGGAGQKEIKDVVANAAQDEPMNISFSNTHVGGFGLARFTLSPEGKRRTPYVDLFGGVRSNSVSMHSAPGNNHEECTSALLDKSFGFSGGAGTGMLFRLSPNMNLDLGLQWHGSTAPGKFIDMKSVVNTGDGIAYSMKNVPTGMLFVKVGIQLRINKYGCCGVRGCEIPAHHSKCETGH